MSKPAIRTADVSTSNSSRTFIPRLAPLLSIFFLILVGALAIPRGGAQDRYQDHDRDHDGFIRVSRDQFDRDFGGGRGGRPSPDAQCELGSVAVGFHVQTGEYFNQAWLDCAPVRPEGWLGDEHRMTNRTGSPGGRPVWDAFCPNGFALCGLRGRTGASIDEAAGVCSPLREIAERRDDPRTAITQPITRPRPGGAVVTGFRSLSGEYMDHLWILCSELHREH